MEIGVFLHEYGLDVVKDALAFGDACFLIIITNK